MFGTQKPASKEAEAAVKPPPSRGAIERALARIKAILGNWFYSEVEARNLIEIPEEIVHFAKLTDAQSSVGGFGHVVVWGTEIDQTLAKVKETLARH